MSNKYYAQNNIYEIQKFLCSKQEKQEDRQKNNFELVKKKVFKC